MSDLISRLRDGVYGINRIPLCSEAADALEAQAKRIAELTEEIVSHERPINSGRHG